MEESKTLLTQILNKVDSGSLKETLTKLKDSIKNSKASHETKKDAIEDSIHQIQRKNKQIESEIERLKLLQSKNAAAFNKKNTERIKYSRKIIELEQENEVLEMNLNELEQRIFKLEDEIKILGYPTLDELYYEIIKGFGVEFTEINGILNAKIKNKTKNDVFTVECDKGAAEVCERIWQCID